MKISVDGLKISRNIDTFVVLQLGEINKDSTFIKPSNKIKRDYLFPCANANGISLVVEYNRAEYFVHVGVRRNMIQEISVIQCE